MSLRMTPEAFEAHQQRVKSGPLPRVAVLDILAPEKPRKYRNKPVYFDRIQFASEAERIRYGQLRILEAAHVIRDLVVHPAFPLKSEGGERIGTYRADFRYLERGPSPMRNQHPRIGLDLAAWIEVVEDVKSPRTAAHPSFIRNCKWVKALYGIDVRVVMA